MKKDIRGFVSQWSGLIGLALAGFLLGTGCQTSSVKPSPDSAEDSRPSSGAAMSPGVDYKISPQDTIVVDVFGEEKLKDKEFKVSATGEIDFYLLGNVKVAGLTPSSAGQFLKDKLDKEQFIKNPQITVRVKEYNKRFINVIGEVRKPGAIELPGEQKWTIPEAIAHADGFTPTAKLKKIKFTRNGRVITVNYYRLLKVTDPTKVIFVEPGDSIEVPQTIF